MLRLVLLNATLAISIHTPLAGSDSRRCHSQRRAVYFNPHSPCGERRRAGHASALGHRHFNPHSPCGERRKRYETLRQKRISIHTPLAGSDCPRRFYCPRCRYFNPHSPCGERLCLLLRRLSPHYFNPHSPCGERLNFSYAKWTPNTFQSTLPLRGATISALGQSPHVQISIHTPLAGSDLDAMRISSRKMLFQSTLPLRGATTQILPANVGH